MQKIFFFILLLFTLSVSAQKPEKERRSRLASKSYSNIIPGYFTVDFGFNRWRKQPESFKQRFWGSRTVNIYYTYPIRLWRSKFTFVPSLGLSLERFKLSNQYTLLPNTADDGTRQLLHAEEVYPYTGVFKSLIITDYVDFPIGFRFDTQPEDVSRSFYVVLGMRLGVLYRSATKIGYRENDERRVAKYTARHGLNLFRYGAYARLGIAAFNLFFVYNLSPYFEAGQSPENSDMKTFTAGISISNL